MIILPKKGLFLLQECSKGMQMVPGVVSVTWVETEEGRTQEFKECKEISLKIWMCGCSERGRAPTVLKLIG